jgi:hypothetical protein
MGKNRSPFFFFRCPFPEGGGAALQKKEKLVPLPDNYN